MFDMFYLVKLRSVTPSLDRSFDIYVQRIVSKANQIVNYLDLIRCSFAFLDKETWDGVYEAS